MARRRVRRLAAGELELLEMLWRQGAVTILQAHRALDLPIGYTTVQTRLNRLVKKGLATKSDRRPAKYKAVVTREEVSDDDLDTLVQRVSEGSVVPLVSQLLNRRGLTKAELDDIKRLIADAEERNSRSSRKPRK